jgi:hypothetical protein
MKKYLWFMVAFTGWYYSCGAQVPVSKEPRHHNIFENSHIRLLDVHIPPGDTTLIHIHATPSVFLILTNTVKVGSQVISEEKRAKLITTDNENIWYESFQNKPRIHRVWNSDTTEYHVMDIELTNRNYKTIDSAFRQPIFNLLFDETPVRVYRLTISDTKIVQIPARKADVLIVRIKDSPGEGSVNGKLFLKKGDYIYIPSGNPIKIKNAGTGDIQYAFFELR